MLSVAPIPQEKPAKPAQASPPPAATAPAPGTDEDLLTRYKARERISDIAKAFGVSPSTISRRLKKLGVRK